MKKTTLFLVCSLVLCMSQNMFGKKKDPPVDLSKRILIVHVLDAINFDAINDSEKLNEKKVVMSNFDQELVINRKFNKSMKFIFANSFWSLNDSCIFLTGDEIMAIEDKSRYYVLSKQGLTKSTLQKFYKRSSIPKVNQFVTVTLCEDVIGESMYGGIEIDKPKSKPKVGFFTIYAELIFKSDFYEIEDFKGTSYNFDLIYTLRSIQAAKAKLGKEEKHQNNIPNGTIYTFYCTIPNYEEAVNSYGFNKIEKLEPTSYDFNSKKELFLVQYSEKKTVTTTDPNSGVTSTRTYYGTRYKIINYSTGELHYSIWIDDYGKRKSKTFFKSAMKAKKKSLKTN